MPQPSGAPSPDDYVNSQDYWDAYYAWLSAQFAAQNKAYSNISDYAWDTFATQPNWVEVTPDLPTVVVTAPRPLPPVSPIETFESPRDFEGYTYNPQTGTPYPPVWQMNDQEYVDFLGGGDAAYEEVWRERHPDEPTDDELPPDESFAPYTLPKFTYPGATPDNPTAEPRAPQKPWPGMQRPPTPPPELPPVEVISRGLPLLTTIVGGLVALLFPQPMGPRILDEAPWWELPPLKAKPIKKPTPVRTIPREDPELPEVVIEQPYFDPVPRRVAPIGDDPGLFTYPFELPTRPAPYFDPTGYPTTDPEPYLRPADPFSDPFTDPKVDPRGDPRTEPRIPTGDPFDPDEYTPGDPYIGTPVTPLPPYVFDPITAPPDTYTIPRGDPILADPTVDVAAPDSNNCDCTDGGGRRKKKKPKKRKPRTVCYRGTYVENANGLTKKRLEEVPCEPKARASRRKKTPGIGDLAKDVFGVPQFNF